MNAIKKCKIFLMTSIGLLLVSCLSLCFSNIVSEIRINQENSMPLYIASGSFWLGLLGAYFCMFCAFICRNIVIERKKLRLPKGLPGIISFFNNKEAKIADVLMLVSIVAVVMLRVLNVNNGFVIIFVVVCMFFLVHLHSILNGRTYRLLKHYSEQKYRYKRERRKEYADDEKI